MTIIVMVCLWTACVTIILTHVDPPWSIILSAVFTLSFILAGFFLVWEAKQPEDSGESYFELISRKP